MFAGAGSCLLGRRRALGVSWLLCACALVTASGCSLGSSAAGDEELAAGRPVVFPVAIRFQEVASSVGLGHEHRLSQLSDRSIMSGGVAAGDYDNDGFVDLFALGGDAAPSQLFRNQGDGTFALQLGAVPTLAGAIANGAVFADQDGDGALDLFVGGVDGTPPRLLQGDAAGHFLDVSAARQLQIDTVANPDSWGGTFADYDLDGDLDLFIPHWEMQDPGGPTQHLWQNQGNELRDVSESSGLGALFAERDSSFTANFADIDEDGDPDLLLTRDFGRSVVLLNDGAGHFVDGTSPVISDSNGMGASVGDYDNDGYLDWFVTSIWSPIFDQPKFGNRLYRGLGDGRFEDVSEPAGIREGWWGWASCFADFDNDADLDIFHVNGIDNRGLPSEGDLFTLGMQFDRSRLFVSDGQGRFVESAVAYGIDEKVVGVGVSCLDYDRDGDVDIVTANNRAALHVFRNEGGSEGQFLTVRLRGPKPNVQGIGARIRLSSAGRLQTRLINAGSNYLSQDPAEAHFGLAAAPRVDWLEVSWPDGARSRLVDVAPRQHLLIEHPGKR